MVSPTTISSDLMSPIKEEAIRAIESLPEDCTYDDILYELYVKKKISEGLEAVEKGDLITHEEVKKRFA